MLFDMFDTRLRPPAFTASRRGLLTALTGGLLAASPLVLAVDEAAAKKNRFTVFVNS
jgi:hypothetical protein